MSNRDITRGAGTTTSRFVPGRGECEDGPARAGFKLQEIRAGLGRRCSRQLSRSRSRSYDVVVTTRSVLAVPVVGAAGIAAAALTTGNGPDGGKGPFTDSPSAARDRRLAADSTGVTLPACRR